MLNNKKNKQVFRVKPHDNEWCQIYDKDGEMRAEIFFLRAVEIAAGDIDCWVAKCYFKPPEKRIMRGQFRDVHRAFEFVKEQLDCPELEWLDWK